MYTVCWQVRKTFFQEASNALLECQFCDMAYMEFVRHFGGEAAKTMYSDYGSSVWAYFYHYVTNKDSSSRAIKVTAAHKEAATKILPALREKLPEAGLNFPVPDHDHLASIVAVLERHVALCTCTSYQHLQTGDKSACERFMRTFNMPIRAGSEECTQRLNLLLLHLHAPLWDMVKSLAPNTDVNQLKKACCERLSRQLTPGCRKCLRMFNGYKASGESGDSAVRCWCYAENNVGAAASLTEQTVGTSMRPGTALPKHLSFLSCHAIWIY